MAASPKAGQSVPVLCPQWKGQPPGEPFRSALLEEASKAKPRSTETKAGNRADLKTPHPIPTPGIKASFRGTACTRAPKAPDTREQEGAQGVQCPTLPGSPRLADPPGTMVALSTRMFHLAGQPGGCRASSLEGPLSPARSPTGPLGHLLWTPASHQNYPTRLLASSRFHPNKGGVAAQQATVTSRKETLPFCSGREDLCRLWPSLGPALADPWTLREAEGRGVPGAQDSTSNEGSGPDRHWGCLCPPTAPPPPSTPLSAAPPSPALPFPVQWPKGAAGLPSLTPTPSCHSLELRTGPPAASRAASSQSTALPGT